jgi:hypothetical protein
LDRKNLHLERIRHIISDSLNIDPAVLIDPALSVDLAGIYKAQIA